MHCVPPACATGRHVLLPNTAGLSAAVDPLREPDRADFTARLRPDVRVADLQ
jgi:hypothetical protein